MSKHQLTDGTKLKYIGTRFEGFLEENPFMLFLGYEETGWSNIWVKYLGQNRRITLADVEIAL
ncbi:hypothetical protein [Mucilaginibacter phyllosphaerae]